MPAAWDWGMPSGNNASPVAAALPSDESDLHLREPGEIRSRPSSRPSGDGVSLRARELGIRDGGNVESTCGDLALSEDVAQDPLRAAVPMPGTSPGVRLTAEGRPARINEICLPFPLASGTTK